MKRLLLWLPLAGFSFLFGIAALGLIKPADRIVRSHLVGKPLPEFRLPPLAAGKPGLTTTDFRQGKPRLLNIFASWCIPCAAEAPQLLRLKAMGIPVDAVAIRDTAPALAAFLRRNGDPYDRIGDDRKSAVQLAIGSSGVPETFVIDGQGRIVLQHVGDIRAEDVDAIAAAVRGAR
ncbi:DsbE family thiol:disulfide interchange protein [Sphingomonas beigongshangi]|jgi:cytochrome c biogenesis protein CcmG, thiol:disulfide interchange protein DsbE|uniref:DsbE family thiol:disulfide interchange protein n=1 Tax=Sphingomonas beigongshangi TaxID=2782540 RepID=UPI001AED28D4|nr:DsbE family thiol:disulfide interchange protein [Sphingomonas beigongshangi]